VESRGQTKKGYCNIHKKGIEGKGRRKNLVRWKAYKMQQRNLTCIPELEKLLRLGT